MAEQAPLARAQRGANGEFACPAGRAREQQIADIHARDQQHEPDRAQQHPQDRPDITDQSFLERDERRAIASVGLGIGVGESPHHSVQIGLRLRERDARLEPANAVKAQAGATILQPGIVPLADRHIDIGAAIEREARREHADNRVALVIQGQAFAQHIRRSTELALPKLCADQDHRGGAGLIFARRKVAPQRRLHAEHREEIRRDPPPADALGFARADQTKLDPREMAIAEKVWFSFCQSRKFGYGIAPVSKFGLLWWSVTSCSGCG